MHKNLCGRVIVHTIVLSLLLGAGAPAGESPANRFHPVSVNTCDGIAIHIWYLHRPGGQQEIQPLGNGSIVRPGDYYGIQVTSEKNCFLYVFARDSSRKLVRLFPSEASGELPPSRSNPIQGRKIYHIPSPIEPFTPVGQPPVRRIDVLALSQANTLLEEHFQMMFSAQKRQNALREQQARAELLNTIESQAISHITTVIHTGWVENQSFQNPMIDRQIGQVLGMSPQERRPFSTKGMAADIPESQLDEMPKTTLLHLFEQHSATILPESYPVLYEYGKALQQDLQNAVLIIAAHTDNSASEAENLNIAQRRAETLQQFFVKEFAIDAKRLWLRAYGAQKPMVSNETAEGRRLNNRIEFIRIQ